LNRFVLYNFELEDAREFKKASKELFPETAVTLGDEHSLLPPAWIDFIQHSPEWILIFAPIAKYAVDKLPDLLTSYYFEKGMDKLHKGKKAEELVGDSKRGEEIVKLLSKPNVKKVALGIAMENGSEIRYFRDEMSPRPIEEDLLMIATIAGQAEAAVLAANETGVTTYTLEINDSGFLLRYRKGETLCQLPVIFTEE